MFEKELAEKFKRIFDFKKVRYDAASDSQEQECLFIDIQKSQNQVKDGKFVGKVTGKISVWANSEKLPYGYFSKRIAEADKADTKDLFFYELEQNAGTMGNIVERTSGFIYLFDMQFDPNVGEITSLETIATVGNEQ
jgi:hypothetical protein